VATKFNSFIFKAELGDTKLVVWRRFKASGNMSISYFMGVIKCLFRMDGGHGSILERIKINSEGRRYKKQFASMSDYPDLNPYDHILQKEVRTLIGEDKRKAFFTLCYGEKWVDVTLEAVLDEEMSEDAAVVLDGQGYGLVDGYDTDKVVREFAAKKGNDFDELKRELGSDFDFNVCSVEEENERLKIGDYNYWIY
jgi:hypothetical protein